MEKNTSKSRRSNYSPKKIIESGPLRLDQDGKSTTLLMSDSEGEYGPSSYRGKKQTLSKPIKKIQKEITVN